MCARAHERGGREVDRERKREGERNHDKCAFVTMEADKVPGQSPWSPRKAEDKGSRSGQQVQSQDEPASLRCLRLSLKTEKEQQCPC